MLFFYKKYLGLLVYLPDKIKVMERTDSVASKSFFYKDALEIAPAIIGQYIVRQYPGSENSVYTYRLKEIEVYRGQEDKANHAHRGKTNRNSLLFEEGGILYVYLIYGMHWMLNIVTGNKNDPQAILIRAIEGYDGPGKLTKALSVNNEFNGKPLGAATGLWFDIGQPAHYITKSRVGIAYADKYWQQRPWRFIYKI